MLNIAHSDHARFLLASTSEVYGDPEEHPQRESYRGRVSTIGPRACYDEGKRCAETLVAAYQQQHSLDCKIARIFNTYGPRMDPADGRVVSNFIVQSLTGQSLTIYGEGEQTRSFQYVTDLIDGLVALMASDCSEPVNLGNPEEYSISELATIIYELTHPTRIPGEVLHLPAVRDDPQLRRPDITKAKQLLGWSPKVPLRKGLLETVEYFRSHLGR
jgi:UDP-glucuronate decarboxylase